MEEFLYQRDGEPFVLLAQDENHLDGFLSNAIQLPRMAGHTQDMSQGLLPFRPAYIHLKDFI